MYPTMMEVMTTLRSHIESSPTFSNREDFLKILHDTQSDFSIHEQNDINAKVVRCITLEGLDGVGKTTLANDLAQLPGFCILRTLPDHLSPFRSYFDNQNEDVKRKYYSLCNIIVSQKLISSSETLIWVLDRYWPSTIAYKVAHQRQIDLSSIPNPLPWPAYLARSSHIVYLYLSEDKRRERIAARQLQQLTTPEEEQLASDGKFRQRLDAIYRRIPNIHLVDADRTRRELVEEILEWFNNS